MDNNNSSSSASYSPPSSYNSNHEELNRLVEEAKNISHRFLNYHNNNNNINNNNNNTGEFINNRSISQNVLSSNFSTTSSSTPVWNPSNIHFSSAQSPPPSVCMSLPADYDISSRFQYENEITNYASPNINNNNNNNLLSSNTPQTYFASSSPNIQPQIHLASPSPSTNFNSSATTVNLGAQLSTLMNRLIPNNNNLNNNNNNNSNNNTNNVSNTPSLNPNAAPNTGNSTQDHHNTNNGTISTGWLSNIDEVMCSSGMSEFCVFDDTECMSQFSSSQQRHDYGLLANQLTGVLAETLMDYLPPFEFDDTDCHQVQAAATAAANNETSNTVSSSSTPASNFSDSNQLQQQSDSNISSSSSSTSSTSDQPDPTAEAAAALLSASIPSDLTQQQSSNRRNKKRRHESSTEDSNNNNNNMDDDDKESSNKRANNCPLETECPHLPDNYTPDHIPEIVEYVDKAGRVFPIRLPRVFDYQFARGADLCAPLLIAKGNNGREFTKISTNYKCWFKVTSAGRHSKGEAGINVLESGIQEWMDLWSNRRRKTIGVKEYSEWLTGTLIPKLYQVNYHRTFIIPEQFTSSLAAAALNRQVSSI